MNLQERFAQARWVADEYRDFNDFAEAALRYLGFVITFEQADIAWFMAHGPRLRMVMAQRGEAKSTLAAIYAVWRLVQNPAEVILIVSGGEAQASEVATLITRLIMQWELLAHLRPDRKGGDRTSFETFDVHWTLKGLNKSPSVSCYGITANLQGKRATLLIPDDIETTKNGLTPTTRAQLLRLTKEFSSMNTHGDILYLGTPQTKDSVYNGLPARGFVVRIWPGRYPAADELERYGDMLAPSILKALQSDPSLQTGGGIDGKRGKPTDPLRFNEETLREKELDQGPETFQLQYMLDTSLVDAQRLQLKLADFVIANFDRERLPEFMVWQRSALLQVQLPDGFYDKTAKLYHPSIPTGVQWAKPQHPTMHVDPAGGGSDEIGFAVGLAHGAYIHVFSIGGLVGGLTDGNAEKILELVIEFGVRHVECESNAGLGLFEKSLIGIFQKARGSGRLAWDVGVNGEFSSGQKERRIINSLVSGMQRHRVVLHERCLQDDIKYNKQHSPEKRTERSLFYQVANITTDRQSLPKDDRIDALAMLVRWHSSVLATNAEEEARNRARAEALEAMRNPMGYDDPAWVAQNSVSSRGIRGAIHVRRKRH